MSSAKPVWSIRLDRRAEKELAKLPKVDQKRIAAFLSRRLLSLDDPRSLGSPLSGSMSGLWRYRIGDYRAIARIEDNIITVTVIRIGHSREIYR